MIYFTADTHFGHAGTSARGGIVEMMGRPFKDIDEHDTELIRRWNAVVGPRDLVYHLGDFSFHPRARSQEILDALNGQKFLILGNHDGGNVTRLKGWVDRPTMMRLVRWENRRITLCHYAAKTWYKASKGALMLYGHSHGSLAGNSQSLDVGVDCWSYAPVSLLEVEERMASLPAWTPVDRHIQKSDDSGTLRGADLWAFG